MPRRCAGVDRDTRGVVAAEDLEGKSHGRPKAMIENNATHHSLREAADQAARRPASELHSLLTFEPVLREYHYARRD
jgi:hypothetical protein